ncbi:hypothetical protein ACFXG4_05065 [Nocardia sp. NPDC059246]|uniref:hypothetical protein n=1 Tax=unclassified Nocardia TaxID=2637762 RepID=UPI0036CFE3D8
MSFLLRRTNRAWAGWRDLDALHSRPNENPIQPPWKRTNTGRTVWLEGNVLKIQDAFETIMQLGGVSYEMQPFTQNWGCEFDLNCDGAVLVQQQFWAACISPTWTSVAFTDLANRPMIAIHRNVGQLGNTLKVMVYHDLNTIETLAETGELSGLMNRTWCRMTILVDRDRLVRAYINGTPLLQQWLPTAYASGPGKRAMNFLNQCTAWSEMKNFVLFDQQSDFQSVAPWSSVYYDDFNRPDGAPGNGWTQQGSNASIVGNSWSVTGGSDSSNGLLRDTGVTSGIQRVEAIVGGNLGPSGGADASLILRATPDGSEGLSANFFSGTIYLSRFTGGLATPTFTDYMSTSEVTVPNGAKAAFACTNQAAWIEVNGQIVLMADVNNKVTTSNSWGGLRVSRRSGSNSHSWNDVRLLTRV